MRAWHGFTFFERRLYFLHTDTPSTVYVSKVHDRGNWEFLRDQSEEELRRYAELVFNNNDFSHILRTEENTEEN